MIFKLNTWRRRPVMLGVVALLAVTGVGGHHITSRTSFCGACHEMKTMYAGWTESVHAKTHCYACHADKGVVGAIKTKAQGLSELVAHFAGRTDMSKVKADVPSARCVACHDMTDRTKHVERVVSSHKKHLEAKLDCLACHAVSGHTRDAFVGFGSTACNPCHDPKRTEPPGTYIHKTPCARPDTDTTASLAEGAAPGAAS